MGLRTGAEDQKPGESYTMIMVDEELCVGCAMCVPICPEEALSCFGPARVNECCTVCLACLEFCPVGALKEKTEKR